MSVGYRHIIPAAMLACVAVGSVVSLENPVSTAYAATRKPQQPLELPAGMTKQDRDIITYAMNIWPATVRATVPQTPNFLDADTFDLMVRDPNRSWTELKIRFRVRNINAPEVRSPKCPAERQLADKATALVEKTLTAPGALIEVTNKDGFDENGRYLAEIKVNGKDLGEMLMSQNPPLARAWTDQYEGQVRTYWCDKAAIRR